MPDPLTFPSLPDETPYDLGINRLVCTRCGQEHISLSPRQFDVLSALARGLDNSEIARELILSIKTVKNYTALLYEILGVHTRTQALVLYREHPERFLVHTAHTTTRSLYSYAPAALPRRVWYRRLFSR